MSSVSPLAASLLVLTKNEGENLSRLLREVLPILQLRFNQSFEVVVIEGGDLADAAKRASTYGVQVIGQSRPGYGPAFVQGVSACRGDWIFTIDADGSHAPALLQAVYEGMDSADLIIGSRYIQGGTADIPVHRDFLSRCLGRICRAIFKIPVQDVSSGYRAYRRCVFAGLELQGAHFDVLVEALLQIHKCGYRIVEVPMHYSARTMGRSHVSLPKFALSYTRTLMRVYRRRIKCRPKQCVDTELKALQRSPSPR